MIRYKIMGLFDERQEGNTSNRGEEYRTEPYSDK